jgi:Sec-independent protein translocase protein TatA
LAKSLGKAMREFKKASEEMRESIEEEIKKVEETKSHFTSMDLMVDSPEKTSKPVALSERTEEPKTEPVSDMKLPLERTPVPASAQEHAKT